MTHPRIMIIGAGLAGPALALGLARQGIPSTIYERQKACQDIGGIISLAPNAVRVLDKIVGVEDDVRRLGYSFDGFEIQACTSTNGRTERLGVLGSGADVKGIVVRRPVVHAYLVERCQQAYPALIRFEGEKNLVRIDERPDGVTAVFDDGAQAEGDIILGADGIHSRVRTHVLGGADAAASQAPYTAKYTGHVVVGGIVPSSSLRSTVPHLHPPAFILSQLGSILVFPADAAGETLQWAAFLPTPERPRREWATYKSSGAAIDDLRAAWASMSPDSPFRAVLDLLDKDTNLLLWAPYDIPGLPRWHTDRVCLLGDAAHAISPSAGQGTAQALEDVGLLVRLLATPSAVDKGYPALFTHYETIRRARMEGIRRMTDATLAARAPTGTAARFWVKKWGWKVALGAMSGLKGILPANPLLAYDVTQESVNVQ